jgi:hydrogenase maturation protein HypF
VIKAYRIEVTGAVQGVGFRPYVYKLAQECSLSGSVLNDATGVQIVIEGEAMQTMIFMGRLPAELPPLARIDTLQSTEIEPQGLRGFEILNSDHADAKSATVSPDMAICGNCLTEMREPSNRRFGHWLINCTDCGPRYSITRTVPYDRPNTSMAPFAMCPECDGEYRDPIDRRYHAQPISCYSCGPKLTYSTKTIQAEGEPALHDAIAALKQGQIVAVKGLGGFHLMCDATNENAVQELRRRKRRPSKPFALMFPTMETIESVGELSSAERDAVDSKERPVVLVRAKTENSIAPSVAPGIDRLGVFLPYTPLHHRLFESIDVPLVATSANLSDEPIIRRDDELLEKLGDVADGVLSHEREIVNAVDDSVMQVVNGRPLLLRLARGFAPVTLTLSFRASKKILAVGPNQKNTIALAFDNRLILSPHIGDLVSVSALEYFERTLETFNRFYDFTPDLIACDKHPGYASTAWAERQSLPVVKVQHHYAHLCAALAEMNSREKVLAFVFDGTGYGDDKSIWGGEVLLGDAKSYERVAHLRPFRLLGGEKAVREPWRVGLSLLFECFTLDDVLGLPLETVRHAGEAQIRLLHKAWEKGLNAPLTSSIGRLFDGVASLSGIAQEVSYEGESGLLVEAAVGDVGADPFTFKVAEGVIDWRPMVREMIAEEGKENPSRFIATLCDVIITIASGYDEKVVLTGGVFQNRTLIEQLGPEFDARGIEWFIPSKFPVNDGAVSLGQLWHVLHIHDQ